MTPVESNHFLYYQIYDLVLFWTALKEQCQEILTLVFFMI